MNESLYSSLIDEGQALFMRGELAAAAQSFERAEALAREAGDEERGDRAFCNHCAVLVELGTVGEQVSGLQRVLLRASDSKTRWMAAYYSAIAYDLRDQREDAQRFARRALELAPAVDEPAGEAATANLVGNLALAASRFEEAEDAYSRSLELYDSLEDYHRLMAAQVRDNLGYTLMCRGSVPPGIDLCEAATTSMRRLEARHYLHQPLQDLCYGYLLVDELERARKCGEEGLELAIALDDRLIIKNLLFLLAQVAEHAGDRFRARRFLSELASWYPELGPSEELLDALMTTELLSVVNLRY